MGQQPSGANGFREVDRDGNPVDEDHLPGATGDFGRGNALAVNPFIAALWLLTILLIGGGARFSSMRTPWWGRRREAGCRRLS
ncbi:hypothetical protein [Arthrobacter sp. P2b]|uniref:hypothetical protein n=1 Tax=Arthrobacter sp. P2b TaxID=1938741 RepID=UPI0009A6A999|nr:hypothetical protein [Arthrobacter sp. P2b]SLK13325.1 hypothetical protein SAMN06272721_11855 [Arthrobacter sp. P2b]